MNFKEWLIQYKRLDSPIGDLARLTDTEKNFPKEETKEQLEIFYTSKPNHRTLELFKIAWAFYVECYE